MKFGKVIGNVVSTNKVRNLNAVKLYIVEYLDDDLNGMNKSSVCADTVNSNAGDIVLLCASSSARMTDITKNACVDNSIVAIVDTISKGRKDIYNKRKHM
jgi:ethanolamine utilization protein EutN